MKWWAGLGGKLRDRLRRHLAELALRVAGRTELPVRTRRSAARSIRGTPVDGRLLRAEISVDRILDLAAEPSTREFLSGRPGTDFAFLLGLIDDETLVPLGHHLLAAEAWNPSVQSAGLYRAVVIDRLTTPRPALRACLLAISSVARRLGRSNQESLFRRCIEILKEPVDPYESGSLVFSARAAAVALLVADSGLEEILLEEIRGDPAGIDSLLDISAGAIRSRDLDRPADLFASVIEASEPGLGPAIAFGELCDTGFSAADPLLPPPRPHRAHPWAARVARHLMPSVLGPLLAALVFVIGKLLAVDLPSGLIVNPGVALGALALLLATHVVSAQLAAERLPGSLARFSSQPRGVVAGYSTGFAMVAASLVSVRASHDELWLQIATVELAAFALSLLATLVALVRRTDPTTAAVGFARDQKHRFQSSGERMGSIQAASVEAQKVIESLPWARRGGSDPLNQRREPLRAARQGFTEIRISRLRALGEAEPWRRRDLVLHVGGALGTLVHRDQELGSILPGREVQLAIEDRERALGVFRVRSELAVEESAEALAALTRLAGDLAAEGNPGGANRVGDSLIGLLGEHLAACHAARGQAPEDDQDEVFPVNLALQMVLTAAVQGIGEADTSLGRRTLATIATRAMGLSWAGDGGVAMALAALPGPTDRELHPEEFELIWEAGARALRIADRGSGHYVDTVLARWIGHADTATTATEVASRLAILHIWIDQHSAGARWEWFEAETEPLTTESVRRVAVARIGAAALLAGCTSVAMRVALSLRDENLDQLRTHLHERAVSAWESFINGQYGFLLGADPEQAMVDFLDFAERAMAAVPQPAEACSADQ